ncbi:AAA family ATPase [Cetobacterium sp.]|uniref:AAA family ATPase n=1 Tax=Cetobacterium sp. TaxID=2071632 RepID=UPI003EE472AF
MLKELEISGYKGFDYFQLKNLQKINIIVGKNNIGKTSLLEGIEYFSNPLDLIKLWKRLSVRKEESNFYYRVRDLFNKDISSKRMDFSFCYGDDFCKVSIKKTEEEKIVFKSEPLIIDEEEIHIKNIINRKLSLIYENMKNDNEEEFDTDAMNGFFLKLLTKEKSALEEKKYLNLNFEIKKNNVLTKKKIKVSKDMELKNENPKELFQCIQLSPLDYLKGDYAKQAITEIIESQNKKLLIKPLKFFDENIIDINYSAVIKDYTLTLNKKGKKYALPISEFGDGLKKTLVLLSHIYGMKSGVLLIDEIENGLHKDVLLDVYRAIIFSAKNKNLQIILTTHSLEAIKNIIYSEENISNIALHKIEKFNERFYVDSYIGEELEEYLFKVGGDPR